MNDNNQHKNYKPAVFHIETVMAPVPTNEMLDDLAVEVMDLQVALAEETNKAKHPELIRKSIVKNFNKFSSVPDFDEGTRECLTIRMNYNPFF